jgi:hypothetical protein
MKWRALELLRSSVWLFLARLCSLRSGWSDILLNPAQPVILHLSNFHPPAAASQTPWQLLPGNETTASGENATGATTGPQKQALGSGQTAGDFAVKAGWIENLRAASGGLGSHVQFAGTGLNEEATRALGNRTWRIGSLWRAVVPQFVVATLTGSGPARISLASPAPALASSGTEAAGLLKQVEIHFPTIIFPPNSTRVQLRSIPLLRRVAEQIKQLPAERWFK